MAESEKAVALKKAYAEIIFNTAKESAGRVMASEKKAAWYHQQLCSTKGEALRLLVRLKQMTDAKIIEAEITSSRQQIKIDELEAQLQEAEGVILDLRAELKCIRDKLEKVRNVQPLNGQVSEGNILSCPNLTHELIIPSISSLELQTMTFSDKKNALLDPGNFNGKYCNATEQSEPLSVSHKSDAALIFVRNNEPEMYRNGCTQRIRALEGTRRLPSSGEVVDQHPILKNELILNVGGNMDEGKCTVPSTKTKSMEMKKNFFVEEVRKRVKVCTLRRRRARSGKTKTKRKSCSSQLMKPYQPPSILSRSKRYSVNASVKSDERSCTLPTVKTDIDMKSLEEKLQNKNHCLMDELIAHKEKRPKMVQSNSPISTSFTSPLDQQSKLCQPFSLLTCCKTYPFSSDGNAKPAVNEPQMMENVAKLKSLPPLDPGVTLIKSGVEPVSGSTNVMVSINAFSRSVVVQIAANKGMESLEEFVKKKCDATPDSTLLCNESNPQIVHIPQLHSELEDAEVCEETMTNVPLLCSDLGDVEAPKAPSVSFSKGDNNMNLMYTFQRKRKKDAFGGSDQNTTVEKAIVKIRAEEIQSDSLSHKSLT